MSTALAILFSSALGRTLGASDFGLYFMLVFVLHLRLCGDRLEGADKSTLRARQRDSPSAAAFSLALFWSCVPLALRW